MSGRTVAVIGALDTKGAEIGHMKRLIEARGIQVRLVDVGTLGEPALAADVPRDEVAAAGGATLADFADGHHKDEAVAAMARGVAAVARRLYENGELDGVLAAGGTGGTSVATAAMRALPFGVPKVMLSTVAGGDVSSYAGTKDIVFVPSVVDVAGFNRISLAAYANAAGALAGMVHARAEAEDLADDDGRPVVAASMFGNTTACVDHARAALERSGYEVLVFHATGSGGRTMEDLIADGLVSLSLDLTTTELADEVCGGVFNAGPDRGFAAARAGIPTVLAPGCVDMANFGPVDTLPEQYRNRRLYEWNPNVTLLRTDEAENARIGTMLAAVANASKGPVAVLLPLGGVSMLDSEGNEFWDPAADAACFDAISTGVQSHVRLIQVDANINDPEFADRAAQVLLELAGGQA